MKKSNFPQNENYVINHKDEILSLLKFIIGKNQ